jgi:hypothetical protein
LGEPIHNLLRTLTMSFDVEQYAASAQPVKTDDIDFGAFRTAHLDEEALRCLRYMHDVESHTVCYLRDLLLTPSHRDPAVTTFLTAWAYEEHWHGAAIGRVLEAHGEAAGAARVQQHRQRLPRKDRFGPYLSAIGGAVAGEDFVALHMTWGAVNEWTTAEGYRLLAERAAHPVLTDLLGRIRRQESRHIAFYASQARERLAASPRARRLTRWALRKLWQPVGSGVMPETETRFLIDWLLAGDAGQAAVARIDTHVDALPGLDGLHLMAGATDRWTRPRATERAAA